MENSRKGQMKHETFSPFISKSQIMAKNRKMNKIIIKYNKKIMI